MPLNPTSHLVESRSLGKRRTPFRLFFTFGTGFLPTYAYGQEPAFPGNGLFSSMRTFSISSWERETCLPNRGPSQHSRPPKTYNLTFCKRVLWLYIYIKRCKGPIWVEASCPFIDYRCYFLHTTTSASHQSLEK